MTLLDHLRRVGDRNQAAAVSYWVGRFSNLMGYTNQATRHLSDALAIAVTPTPCPYYEVPTRAELALTGDASQVPRLRHLADTLPLRGLEDTACLLAAEARHARPEDAEERYARALEVADRYCLVMDRVEVLTRRSFHRLRHGDVAGRHADVEQARELCQTIGLTGTWELTMQAST